MNQVALAVLLVKVFQLKMAKRQACRSAVWCGSSREIHCFFKGNSGTLGAEHFFAFSL